VPYCFIQDVPANEEMYRQIMELVPRDTPPGLITHVAAKRDGGLRYVDVWESEADWQRFHESVIEPAVTKVLAGYGIEHTHDGVTIDELDVIHVWRG
jgi:hypothetical protein